MFVLSQWGPLRSVTAVKPAALFLSARLIVHLRYGTSGLNGCKEAAIPAFPLHFFILMFVVTLFLYINVCNVH